MLLSVPKTITMKGSTFTAITATGEQNLQHRLMKYKICSYKQIQRIYVPRHYCLLFK